MAKLRKGVAYRRLERPYTRKSKYKNLSYVRSTPTNKVVKFDMGNYSKKFPHKVLLVSKADIQLRHNAIESARMACIRKLEGNLGKSDFRFQVRVYPHHILRENPLAAGAGADRMSTGMQRSFGKCIGLAAQVRKGKTIFSVDVEKVNLDIAKKALKSASHKFACQTSITLEY
ncbi:MAG: 50S ribosomal protein L16 [Candidatus Woesearchaeota archaeon]|jgi:large subunit ribosomal protein L10e